MTKLLYSVCCKEIGIAMVGINKLSELPSFTMWDNSVQDSYQELSDQKLVDPMSSSLLSPPYSRLV